jgi:hypothetical protein
VLAAARPKSARATVTVIARVKGDSETRPAVAAFIMARRRIGENELWGIVLLSGPPLSLSKVKRTFEFFTFDFIKGAQHIKYFSDICQLLLFI